MEELESIEVKNSLAQAKLTIDNNMTVKKLDQHSGMRTELLPAVLLQKNWDQSLIASASLALS